MRDTGGAPFLYADTFLSEPEFKETFCLKRYQRFLARLLRFFF